MTAVPKPLSSFERNLLASLWTKLRPRVDQAIEDAKDKLHDALGPKNVKAIAGLLDEADQVAVSGSFAVPAGVRKALSAVVAAGSWLGLAPPQKA